MDRFYQSGAVASPPAAPGASSGNYPTAGNPSTSTPATKPGAYWFYMVTESLRNVVTFAGLTPDHTNLNQLRLAISQMISDAVQNFLTPTGKVGKFARSSAPTGWVRLHGGTIGNASSGASERAHADTEALFTLLWEEFDDTLCPVIGGRGASAAADFAANKRLTLFNDQGLHDRAWDEAGSINPTQGLGEYQADDIKAHVHAIKVGSEGMRSPADYSRTLYSTSASNPTGTTQSTGGAENRVKSRAYLQCIKL